MNIKKEPKEENLTKENNSQAKSHEDNNSFNNLKRLNYTQADFEDYWAHKIVELAKKKMFAYFAILGILVSVVITLVGMGRIHSLVDEKYVNQLVSKEKEATKRIDSLANTFEKKLESIQSRLEKRSDEFHRIVGVTLAQVKTRHFSEISVDLSNDIGPIGNQGDDGSSVGFAVAYALTAEYMKVTEKREVFSARSIYVEARREDRWEGENYEGTSVLGALQALKKVGAYFEKDWPYKHKYNPLPTTESAQKIKSFKHIPLDNLDQVINYLKNGKPVIVTLKATEEFGKVGQDGKIFLTKDIKVQGGHAVCLVGYEGAEDQFKFANTWGKLWGNSGFGYIGLFDLQKIIDDAFILSI